MKERALLIVDTQNDFCPKGTLPVPNGDKVVPVLNHLIDSFVACDEPIFASRDWHKEKNSVHFKPAGSWPKHCVQNTEGAEFHKDLKLPKNAQIISKGMSDEDAYSAFDGTGLEKNLRELGVKEIWIGGLALDYCVKATALEAKKLGFEVVVVLNATRAVNIDPDDGEKAVEEMHKARITTLYV